MDSTAATVAADLWDRVFGSQPDPDLWLVIATRLVAARRDRPARRLAALPQRHHHRARGRPRPGRAAHRAPSQTASGCTPTPAASPSAAASRTGLGMILTAAAGYTAPPLLGLGGAALLAAGHITAAAVAGHGPAPGDAGDDPQRVRRAHRDPHRRHLRAGVLARRTPGAGRVRVRGGVVPAARRRPARPSSCRPSAGRGGAGDSDADQLSRLTHVPAGLWLFLFHAVSLCSLIGGGRWLLEL